MPTGSLCVGFFWERTFKQKTGRNYSLFLALSHKGRRDGGTGVCWAPLGLRPCMSEGSSGSRAPALGMLAVHAGAGPLPLAQPERVHGGQEKHTEVGARKFPTNGASPAGSSGVIRQRTADPEWELLQGSGDSGTRRERGWSWRAGDLWSGSPWSQRSNNGDSGMWIWALIFLGEAGFLCLWERGAQSGNTPSPLKSGALLIKTCFLPRGGRQPGPRLPGYR